MIGIIDYGMGNLLSVKNAFEMAGADVKICSNPEELFKVDKLVLPGVGAFGDCITNLKKLGFKEALDKLVLIKQKPILGICLGMQVMASKGYEGGVHDGLGWFDAEVIKLTPKDKKLRIPHIGWNNIDFKPESPIFRGLRNAPDVYFVHSYYMKCNNFEDIDATFEYGGVFTAAVRKRNIVATQFHPEKSQDIGQVVINNFLKFNS